MIANVRQVMDPVIREVYGDYQGQDDRLLLWDASLIDTVAICQGDCPDAKVDEDGDRVHAGFAVVLNMIAISGDEPAQTGCYLIPEHLLLSGDLTKAMNDLRTRLEFNAQASGLEDLREISESIIQEYRG